MVHRKMWVSKYTLKYISGNAEPTLQYVRHRERKRRREQKREREGGKEGEREREQVPMVTELRVPREATHPSVGGQASVNTRHRPPFGVNNAGHRRAAEREVRLSDSPTLPDTAEAFQTR